MFASLIFQLFVILNLCVLKLKPVSFCDLCKLTIFEVEAYQRAVSKDERLCKMVIPYT